MSRPPTSPRPAASVVGLRRFQVVTGGLIAVHLALRAWAVFPSYFYGDDFRLVDEARSRGLSASYLLEPYDAQFMPWGRFLAWIAARAEPINWPLLASMSWLMAAFAALTCLWMLLTLFGRRWAVPVLLAVYLSSALTVSGFQWWAAALNQMPLQSVFFGAVAAWVRYLRSRRVRWLVLTLAIVAFGLACYVKTLLVLPVLAFVSVGYFATGGPIHRVASVLRTSWPAAVAGGLGGVAFLVYYLTAVPQITTDEQPTRVGALADEMIGNSFATALTGGPWRWNDVTAPAVLADAPNILVHVSWVAIALTVAYVTLRRRNTGRAWLFLGGYILADFLLLLTTRAQDVGAIAGSEYRYLSDAACAAVLALGLATLDVVDAPDGSRERTPAVLTRSIGRPAVAVLVVAVVGAGLWSGVRYASFWHDAHRGRAMLTTAAADLNSSDATDLANQFLPAGAIGAVDPRFARTDFLLPLLSPRAAFPPFTDRLRLLDGDGHLVDAVIDEATRTLPGPAPGCGWALTSTRPRSLPLGSSAIDREWWLRIDYLASNDSGMTVVAGRTAVAVDVQHGLNEIYVRVRGELDDIRLSGIDAGVTVCVDKVVVGTPKAAGAGDGSGPDRAGQDGAEQ